MKKPKPFEPKKPRPNMWDKEPESVKAISLKNERRLAEKLGFKVTPGSGNTPWPSKKGDGEHLVFMFEQKETRTATLSIGRKVIEKLCREAAVANRQPALVLCIYGMENHLPQEWIAVPVDVFSIFLELLTKQ